MPRLKDHGEREGIVNHPDPAIHEIFRIFTVPATNDYT